MPDNPAGYPAFAGYPVPAVPDIRPDTGYPAAPDIRPDTAKIVFFLVFQHNK